MRPAVPSASAQLRTEGFGLAHGTLRVRRSLMRHALYLEEFTHYLAALPPWLRRPAGRRRAAQPEPQPVNLGGVPRVWTVEG